MEITFSDAMGRPVEPNWPITDIDSAFEYADKMGLSLRIKSGCRERVYGPSQKERLDVIRAEVSRLMDDPNWTTADGFRAMVPKYLLRKLLANDPDA